MNFKSDKIISILKSLTINSLPSLIIVFFAISGRIIMQLQFFKLGSDRALQLVCARNFMDGKGIALDKVSTSNLEAVAYEPLVGWPPGYPVIVGIISFFVGKDVITAAIIFDLFCILILIFSSRKILHLAGCSISIINLYTLLLGFFIYDFMESSTSDLNAIAFFILSFYLAMRFIKNNKREKLIAILVGIACFVPVFLRYMFLPVAFIIPLYLLFTGYKNKEKRIISGAWISMITLSFCIIALFIYQQQNTGSLVYIYPTQTGFYPENLLHFYPVFLASFMNIETYYSAGERLNIIQYGQYDMVIWILNLVAALCLIFLFIRHYLHRKMAIQNTNDHFILPGGISALSILGLLLALSLYYSATTFPDHEWTYVNEARYMGFVVLFIQMAVFILLYQKWSSVNSGLKLLGIFIALLLTFEVVHGMYVSGKRLVTPYKDPAFIQQKKYVTSLNQKLNQSYPHHNIVFSSNDESLASLASLAGSKTLYAIPHQLPRQNSPFILIMMIYEQERKNMISFLQNTSIKKLNSIGNLHFYEYRPEQ